MIGLLSACADPLRNVERLNEVALPEAALVASALPGAADSADAPPVLGQLLTQGQAGSDAGSSAETPIASVGTYVPSRQGFWAQFGQPEADPQPQDTEDPASASPEMLTDASAMPTDDITDDITEDVAVEAAAAPARQGFWAQFSAPEAPIVPGQASSATNASAGLRSGPDAQQVAAGTLLPYGQIATVCGQPEAALGTRVATGAGYTLYDSAANSTALRVQYLTGFSDGCARTFSAALVLFGDVGTHEAIRYLPSNASMAYSGTDTVYEQVKTQVCSVPQGQPCGRNIDRFAAHSTFLTIYETFGTNPEWGEIFVHQGQVMAIDVRRG